MLLYCHEFLFAVSESLFLMFECFGRVVLLSIVFQDSALMMADRKGSGGIV